MAIMDLYRFIVRGESGEYEITFSRKGNYIKAKCTCPAGENGLHCKHRIEIMRGKTSNILSGNETEVGKIKDFIKGTDIEKAFIEFEEAEIVYEFAQKQFAKAKKLLAKAMIG
jgi:uncharacterized Zn finger protein